MDTLLLERMIKGAEADEAIWLALQISAKDNKAKEDFQWMWMHIHHYRQRLELMLTLAKEGKSVASGAPTKMYEVKVDMAEGEPVSGASSHDRFIFLKGSKPKLDVEATSGMTEKVEKLTTDDKGRLKLPYGDSFTLKYEGTVD